MGAHPQRNRAGRRTQARCCFQSGNRRTLDCASVMWDTCAWGATMVMMERTTACALVTKGECATWSLRVDTFCVCVCKFRAGRKKKRKSVGADEAISNHFRFLYAPPCIP